MAISQARPSVRLPTVRLNMVAWCIVTSLSSCRADTRIPSFARDFPRAMSKLTTEPVSKTASTALLAFPSNTPSARDALDWLTVNRPRLSADQRTLLHGYEPRCLLQYEHDTVPPLLVVSVDGATATMVAARDVSRMSITDQNRKRDKLKDVMVADIKELLFNDIESSMLETAALLLSQFKIDYMQAAPFSQYRDGCAAWLAIEALSKPSAQRPGEASEHDAKLVALALKPLPAGASAQEFSQRVTDFTTHNMPYLDRPFSSKAKEAEWVLQQVPITHGSECRGNYDRLSDAQKSNPLYVAKMCADIMARAQPADVMLREGALSEFVGLADTEVTNGRRPQGLGNRGTGKGAGRGGGGRGAGGKGAGRGGGGRGPPKGCSVASPRGPMCKLDHHNPCWRDNLWPGPLPARVARISKAVTEIETDRAANAQRLGEKCVALEPTPEDVAMLDIDDETFDQWPEGADAESDVGPEAPPPVPNGDLDDARTRWLAEQAAVRAGAGLYLDSRGGVQRQAAAVAVSNMFTALSEEKAKASAAFSAPSLIVPPVDLVISTELASSKAEATQMRLQLRQMEVDSQAKDAELARLLGAVKGATAPAPLTDVQRAAIAEDAEKARLMSAVTHADAPVFPCPGHLFDPMVSHYESEATLLEKNRALKLELDRVKSEPSVAPAPPRRAPSPGPAPEPDTPDPDVDVMDRTANQVRLTADILLQSVVVALIGIACVLAYHFFISSSIDGGEGSVGSMISHYDRWHGGVAVSGVVIAASQFNNIRRIGRGNMVTLVFVVFMCVCVKNTSASQPSVQDLVLRQQLPAIAYELGDSPVARASLSIATSVSEHLYNIKYFDFVSTDEIVATLGFDELKCIIWDTGAKRCVICDPSIFVPGTQKPCPFRIRGVNSVASRPHSMGDVDIGLPLEDGSVVTVRAKGVVCILNSPHDIISPCALDEAGVCSWNGELPDGRKVLLHNHRFLVMPRCAAGSKSHDYPVPERVLIATDVFASKGASENTCPQKAASVAAVVTPKPVTLSPARGMLYWFSGECTPGSVNVSSLWASLGVVGGTCVCRDIKNSVLDSVLRDDVYRADLTSIQSGKTNRGLFSHPCNTFSVSLFKKHPRLKPLRGPGKLILGLPGLDFASRAKVDGANLMSERTCDLCLALHEAGGLFIVENPVRRNDPTGPWKRFNSGKFPLHGSFWQLPRVLDLARRTDALVLHLPFCWFTHCDLEECPEAQKYVSLMYSKRLEPALGFLRRTRCYHKSHAKTAVGFSNTSGRSLGAPTAKYFAELDRIIVRALACPDRCASDDA